MFHGLAAAFPCVDDAIGENDDGQFRLHGHFGDDRPHIARCAEWFAFFGVRVDLFTATDEDG